MKLMNMSISITSKLSTDSSHLSCHAHQFSLITLLQAHRKKHIKLSYCKRRIKVNMNASKEKASDANLLQPSQAVQGHTPTNSISTATSATGSPTTIDLISESESLRNQ